MARIDRAHITPPVIGNAVILYQRDSSWMSPPWIACNKFPSDTIEVRNLFNLMQGGTTGQHPRGGHQPKDQCPNGTALGGEGMLTFMGNEFGHPEWVDMPAPRNAYSFAKAGRRWALRLDPGLVYGELERWNSTLIQAVKQMHEMAFGENDPHTDEVANWQWRDVHIDTIQTETGGKLTVVKGKKGRVEMMLMLSNQRKVSSSVAKPTASWQPMIETSALGSNAMYGGLFVHELHND